MIHETPDATWRDGETANALACVDKMQGVLAEFRAAIEKHGIERVQSVATALKLAPRHC